MRLASERELATGAVEFDPCIDLGIEHDGLGARERTARCVQGSGKRAASAAELLLLRARVAERDVEAVAQAGDPLVRGDGASLRDLGRRGQGRLGDADRLRELRPGASSVFCVPIAARIADSAARVSSSIA